MALGIVVFPLLSVAACVFAFLIAFVTTLVPAQAGENMCQGVVIVDSKWVTIHNPSEDKAQDDPDYKRDPDWHPSRFANDCRTLRNSNVGRRTLAVCPVGSKCLLFIPLNDYHPNADGLRTFTTLERDGAVRCDGRRNTPASVFCDD